MGALRGTVSDRPTAVGFSLFVFIALTIPCSVAVVMLCGGALEVVFFRRLRSPSILQMIVITIGLSIVIREAALHIWDEKVRSLPYFTGDECSSVRVLRIRVPLPSNSQTVTPASNGSPGSYSQSPSRSAWIMPLMLAGTASQKS